ncbi:MAG: DUF6531 domain-containing protein [Patescibacteria group bacterium]
MGSKRTAVAVFGSNPVTSYNISVTKSDDGTVTSNPPGINCGSDCSESYSENTFLTLTAFPGSGKKFVWWENGPCDGSTNPQCSFYVSGDINTHPVFEPINYFTLSVTITGNGSGTTTGQGTYLENTTAILEAAPGEDSYFGGWTGDCTSSDITCEVDMTSDKIVNAEFDALPNLRNNTYTGENNEYGKIELPPHNPDFGQGEDNTGNVLLHSGEFYYNTTDIEIDSLGSPFRFERIYKSQIDYNGPLGHNWDFNYNMHLSQDVSGDITIIGNGRSDTYTYLGGVSYLTPDGLYNFLKKNDDSFTLTEKNKTEYNFHAFDGSRIAGSLQSIVDRNDNEMTFSYSSAGLLTQITDTVGRVITLTYYTSGVNLNRLYSLQDFANRSTIYTYSDQGDLIAVRSPVVVGTPNGNDFPEGKTTKYTYSSGYADGQLNHNLMTVTNPNETALEPYGPAYLSVTYGENVGEAYNYDKVLVKNYVNGRMSFFYEELNPGADPDDISIVRNETTVVDRVGNIAGYQHNINGNRLKLKEFTGRTDSFDPVIPPTIEQLRPDDPPFFITLYQYSSQTEITRLVFPLGNCIDYHYDEANADVYQRGNLLAEKRRPNTGASDPESIITNFTYEPNFNFVKTKTDPLENTTINFFDYEEAGLGQDLNGDGRLDQDRGNLVMIRYPEVTLGAETPQIIEEKFVYDDHGQLIKEIQGEGNAMSYQYYPETGYLWKSIKASGDLDLTTEYQRDSVGNATKIIDPKGYETNYTYNSLDQIVYQNYLVDEKKFWYDGNNNLTQEDMTYVKFMYPEAWLTTTYTHNLANELTSQTEEVSNEKTVTTHFEYDGNGNQTRLIQPLGNSTLTQYDERDLVFKYTRGEGDEKASTIIKNYNSNGNLRRYIDGRGWPIDYVYDGFDRVSNINYQQMNQLTQVYDNNSNIIHTELSGYVDNSQHETGILAMTDYQFNEMGWMYEKDEHQFDLPYYGYSDIKYTNYYYDNNGQVIMERDSNSNDTLYDFDQADRLTKITDALGNEYRYAYDNNSNIIQDQRLELSQLGSPPQTITTTYEYEEPFHWMRVTDNMGNQQVYELDSFDNVILEIDARGNITNHFYDGLGRKYQTEYEMKEDGGGDSDIIDTIIVNQAWDDNSRLLSQTDDNGHTTGYVYDPLNRLNYINNPYGTDEYFMYDANDNLTYFTDQNGTEVYNYYDYLNRLEYRTVDPAEGVEGTTWENYGYNGLSLMTYAANENMVNVMRYDSLGYLTYEEQGNNFSVYSNYDPIGTRQYFNSPSGWIHYEYDALNRPSSLGSEQIYTNYHYFGPSRLERREMMITSCLGCYRTLNLTYDELGRVTDMQYKHTHLPLIFSEFQYGYDEASNLLYEIKDYEPWNGYGDVFTYDSLDQVNTGKLGVPDPIAESEEPGSGGSPLFAYDYNYDGVGNRTSVVDTHSTSEYESNEMNEYTNVDDIGDLWYDTNGNLKGQTEYNQYVYDYRNQLVEVQDPGGYPQVTFNYDVFGRRVSKTANGHTEQYYYDQNDLIAVYENNLLVSSYLYGPAYHEPIQIYQDGQRYYLHEDAMGSIIQVTDQLNNIVGQFDYDPFGALQEVPSFDVPFMFRGMQYDENIGIYEPGSYDSGLYYDGRRYYDPTIGRYLQRDPGGMWQADFNLGNGYSYLGNSPFNNAVNISYQQESSPMNQIAVNIVDKGAQNDIAPSSWPNVGQGQLGTSADAPRESAQKQGLVGPKLDINAKVDIGLNAKAEGAKGPSTDKDDKGGLDIGVGGSVSKSLSGEYRLFNKTGDNIIISGNKLSASAGITTKKVGVGGSYSALEVSGSILDGCVGANCSVGVGLEGSLSFKTGKIKFKAQLGLGFGLELNIFSIFQKILENAQKSAVNSGTGGGFTSVNRYGVPSYSINPIPNVE